jgi:hypothetical protein
MKSKIDGVLSLTGLICFTVTLALMPVLLTGCGGGKEAEKALTLNVKIVNVEGLINEDAFAQVVQQFATTKSGAIISCTAETVSPDLKPEELAAQFGQCDVVIYPSLFNKQLRTQSNFFYPIQGIEINLPSFLDLAYAGATESSRWSVPLVVDPMMMYVKKSGVDDDFVPGDWQTIYMRAKMMELRQPVFVFPSNPVDLADSIAQLQFGAGYQTEILHHTPPEIGVTNLDKQGVYTRAMINMKKFMIEPVENRLEQIPQASGLDAFLESHSFATIARYSSYMNLPENKRNRMAQLGIPYTYGPVSVCNAIAVGIPIQSANPALGVELIQHMVKQIESLAANQKYLGAQLSADKEMGIKPFSSKTVFILREDNGALSEKVVIDAINGDLGIEELDQLWVTSLFIPSANL